MEGQPQFTEEERRRNQERQTYRNHLQEEVMKAAFPKSPKPIIEWMSEENGLQPARQFGDWFDRQTGTPVDPSDPEAVMELIRSLGIELPPTLH